MRRLCLKQWNILCLYIYRTFIVSQRRTKIDLSLLISRFVEDVGMASKTSAFVNNCQNTLCHLYSKSEWLLFMQLYFSLAVIDPGLLLIFRLVLSNSDLFGSAEEKIHLPDI